MSGYDRINEFIVKFARKIERFYPNGCSDIGDYIQEGHLKLAQIKGDKNSKRDFYSYAITCIARAMRKSAINSTCAVSAPLRVKLLANKANNLLLSGYTEQEVCIELNITSDRLKAIRQLVYYESWNRLFKEPIEDSELFSFFSDILESEQLTDEDITILQLQFEDTIDNLDLDRNRVYRKMRNIRPKLVRSGYGD